MATSMNVYTGYDKTVREVVLEKGNLTEEEADEVLDPRKMTERGILGQDD